MSGIVLRVLMLALVAASASCGGGSPTPTTTQPTTVNSFAPPTAITISGTTIDTISGATVGSFSATTQSFPTLVKVEAPGYLSRDVYVTSATPTVDLIPESALAYYRNLVRNGFDNPQGVASTTLKRWSAAPSVYVRTVDYAGNRVDTTMLDMVPTALDVVQDVSNKQLSVANYERGTDTREGVETRIRPRPGLLPHRRKQRSPVRRPVELCRQDRDPLDQRTDPHGDRLPTHARQSRHRCRSAPVIGPDGA